MDDIFIGSDASNCDGEISGYSSMWHILFNELGDRLEEKIAFPDFFKKIVEQEWEPKLEVYYAI